MSKDVIILIRVGGQKYNGFGKYINFYNNERYQERYDSKTPMEVRTEALQVEKPILYPIPVNLRIVKYKQYLAELSASKNPTGSAPIGQVLL